MHPVILFAFCIVCPHLLAESMWERPSLFGIPFGVLFLFWLVMQSLRKGNASSEESRSELQAIRRQQDRERREKERQNKQPKCPCCGGRLEEEYPKCMHCASDLTWKDGKPFRPGDEQHFIPPYRDAKAESDPFAWKVCSHCGKKRFLSMFRAFDSSGRPSGPTHAVCSTCRDRN